MSGTSMLNSLWSRLFLAMSEDQVFRHFFALPYDFTAKLNPLRLILCPGPWRQVFRASRFRPRGNVARSIAPSERSRASIFLAATTRLPQSAVQGEASVSMTLKIAERPSPLFLHRTCDLKIRRYLRKGSRRSPRERRYLCDAVDDRLSENVYFRRARRTGRWENHRNSRPRPDPPPPARVTNCVISKDSDSLLKTSSFRVEPSRLMGDFTPSISSSSMIPRRLRRSSIPSGSLLLGRTTLGPYAPHARTRHAA